MLPDRPWLLAFFGSKESMAWACTRYMGHNGKVLMWQDLIGNFGGCQVTNLDTEE